MKEAEKVITELVELMSGKNAAGVVIILGEDKLHYHWVNMGIGGAIDAVNTAKKSMMERLIQELK